MMKKLLFLLFFSGSIVNVHAQLIVSPNPFGLTSGTITLTYGSAGDYSLFDPQSDPNLYLYTGLETDGVASTWDYHDTWSDINSLIPLTWNATANAYVANFDIATRTYFSEFTQSNGSIPNGTTVNNWYFIIRNAAGTSQSGDFQGTNFGFTPATASAISFEKGQEIKFFDGKVISTISGNTTIEIFNLLGQKVKTLSINENESSSLNLTDKGLYVAIIKNNAKQKNIKFLY